MHTSSASKGTRRIALTLALLALPLPAAARDVVAKLRASPDRALRTRGETYEAGFGAARDTVPPFLGSDVPRLRSDASPLGAAGGTARSARRALVERFALEEPAGSDEVHVRADVASELAGSGPRSLPSSRDGLERIAGGEAPAQNSRGDFGSLPESPLDSTKDARTAPEDAGGRGTDREPRLPVPSRAADTRRTGAIAFELREQPTRIVEPDGERFRVRIEERASPKSPDPHVFVRGPSWDGATLAACAAFQGVGGSVDGLDRSSHADPETRAVRSIHPAPAPRGDASRAGTAPTSAAGAGIHEGPVDARVPRGTTFRLGRSGTATRR